MDKQNKLDRLAGVLLMFLWLQKLLAQERPRAYLIGFGPPEHERTWM